MSSKLPIIWDLSPHTAAKHTLLRNYLQAWMRIMTLGYNRDRKAVFIDGFSGPGEYSKGEDGSPIIALKETINYSKSSNNSPQLRFIFIEEDEERYENLIRKIADLFNESDISKLKNTYTPEDHDNLRIITLLGSFEFHMNSILTSVKGNLAPTFAFIDPFGFKAMPFDVIERLLENDKSEVFINFMYEDINRFLTLPSLQNAYNKVFGTKEWKRILDHLDSYSPEERRYFLHTLYKEQLHKAGLKHVISFEMKNSNNATEYFLYYGTNHIKGLEKMKDAMWLVDNSGAYSYSDYKANQLQLELSFTEFDSPDMHLLADLIFEEFSGKCIDAERIKNFVITDTIFRKSVHSNQALKILEDSGKIKDITGRKRNHGFPDHCMITFIEK